MIAITAKIDSALALRIETIAIQKGVSRNEIVREAIEKMLKEGKVPEVPTSDKCKFMLTLKVEEDMLRELNKFKQEHGITRSEAIRKALRSYVRQDEKRLNYLKAQVEVLVL